MINKLATYTFTTNEQKAIKELLHYCNGKTIESARILKNDKDITDKFIIKESEYRNSMDPRGEVLPCHEANCPLFNLVKRKLHFKDSTYIHFHPRSLPLSFGDVLTAFIYRMKKIVAVSADGKFSIFIPNPHSKVPRKELYAGNEKLSKLIREQGEGYILDNPTNFKNYKQAMHMFWQNLAERTDSKYISDM
ncbi:hypothetical protein IJE86_03680 [bacterium]|nr:hypothetical protein [bacterium]